jgi:predicted O-methyltransferase YrrM
MHNVLAKCLMLLDDKPKASLKALSDSGGLERAFGDSFNRFLSEIGFEDFLRRSNIRELFCAELFEGIGDIALPLSISNEASHHANHMDMLFVVAIAKHRNARRIFEFGTYLGRTTCGLASIDESVLVHTLNLPVEEDPRYGSYIGQLIKKSPYQDRIRQLFCDSRKFVTDPYASSMDFIFIDADHSHEGVKNDTEKAFQMLAPGGVVIWHDFAPKSPGVYGYLYELSRERSLFRIRNTCLVIYIDGVDASTFSPARIEAMLEVAE